MCWKGSQEKVYHYTKWLYCTGQMYGSQGQCQELMTGYQIPLIEHPE